MFDSVFDSVFDSTESRNVSYNSGSNLEPASWYHTSNYDLVARALTNSSISDRDVERIADAVVDRLQHRSPLHVSSDDIKRLCPELIKKG